MSGLLGLIGVIIWFLWPTGKSKTRTVQRIDPEDPYMNRVINVEEEDD